MKTLLVATTNPGKLAELRGFLSELPLKFVSLSDIGITDTVEETGKTFKENAILKAKYNSKKSGLPTLADDGGFEIDALGGQPGVKSHRWVHGNRESSDEDLIAFTFEKMKDISEGKRGAQLRLVLALAFPDGRIFTSEAKIHGIVPKGPSSVRHPGFPYRSILFIPEINKYYDHEALTEAESKTYNHRRKAIEDLKPIIRETLC